MTKSLPEHRSTAVAVIGMSGRFPGAPDLDSYWLNLREGVESIVRHRPEDLLARGVRPSLLDNPHYVPASAALDDADCFDAAFFGYSSREASIIDPQHRVFLEAAYHALEDAAYDSRRYDGLIGVYGGCTMNTYLLYNVMARADDVIAMVGDLGVMVGNDKDYLASRVSYKLGLRGPSIALQTACSSSLVAIHMACRALLDGECDMALAGGASVRLPLASGYLANPGGTSSPDGHCRTFDADAAGSVVGNGVGVVVLKRLEDAERDGDRIDAVVAGSAVNNDGHAKASFTAPSVEGQSRAVVRALERAGVDARHLAFVECHGTGTPLGDPIEVAALSRAFRTWTDATGYCWLGSVKPNIGHLDAAAGVAGFIKAVLAIKHRQMPPVLHFRRPNPRLDLEATPFRVPTELSALESDGPLLASVNSLAMGGTNAHVVLREAPAGRRGSPSNRPRHPVLVSARTPEALEALSVSIGQRVRDRGAYLADIAHTLATGRRELDYRRVLLAGDLDDVAFGLSTRGSRRQRDGRARQSVRTVLLFPGQGTQRVGMGARLAEGDPVFARHLDAVLECFRGHAGVDLRPVLYPEAGDTPAARAQLAATEWTQPALFAVEWALGRTLFDYGLRPYAMVGHSIGEVVAATLGGVFSLADAATLVAQRGRLLAGTPKGAMLYASLCPEDAAERLAGRELSVAAVNAPGLVAVAGAPGAIEALQAELAADGVACGRLDVTRAFHSPLVEEAAAALSEVVAGLTRGEPAIPIVSNVSGRYLAPDEASAPGYWADQARRPVRFADGLATVIADGATVFLEVGPGRQLSGLARAAAPDAAVIGALDTADASDLPDLLEPLTAFWLEGGECDWAAFYADEEREAVALPSYPFARTRHWLAPPVPANGAAAPVPAPVPEPASQPGSVSTVDAAPFAAHAAAPSSPIPPRPAGLTPTQRYLVDLWGQLLDAEDIGLADSFFDLNGHSLLAMQMVTQLRADGAPELEMTAVFEMPTIAELARHLDSAGFRPPQGAPAAGLVDDALASGADGLDEAALVARVEALSDEEVHALLAEFEASEDR